MATEFVVTAEYWFLCPDCGFYRPVSLMAPGGSCHYCDQGFVSMTVLEYAAFIERNGGEVPPGDYWIGPREIPEGVA